MVLNSCFGQLGLHPLFSSIRLLVGLVVLSQVVASAEAFRTAVTSERSLLRMCTDVPLQVFEPFEDAATGNQWTREALARGIGRRRDSDCLF